MMSEGAEEHYSIKLVWTNDRLLDKGDVTGQGR